MSPETSKVLERSVKDKVLAGVFGGLGEYFNIDPNILRLVGIILVIIAPIPMITLYCVATLIIPRKNGASLISPPLDIPRLFPLIAGLILLIVGIAIIGGRPWDWFVWSLPSLSAFFKSLFGLLVAIIGLGILIGELRRL